MCRQENTKEDRRLRKQLFYTKKNVTYIYIGKEEEREKELAKERKKKNFLAVSQSTKIAVNEIFVPQVCLYTRRSSSSSKLDYDRCIAISL